MVIEHTGFLKDDAAVEQKISRYFERNRRYRLDHPDDAMAWYNEALHLQNDGQEDEAIAYLERAMELGKAFLSPRTQLAYIFQERALRLWESLLESIAQDHPIRPAAVETCAALRRVTPPRPYVGHARQKRMT
jgi:tetratricopeptide (TPR) repeat protein